METSRPKRGSEAGVIYELELGGKSRVLEVKRTESGWSLRLDGREAWLNAERIDQNTLSILKDGESFAVRRLPNGGILVRGRYYQVALRDRRSWRGRGRSGGGADGFEKLTATMPGKVVRLLAREGETISANQGIVVVEAMKMQNEIRSRKAGVLRRLLAEPGMNVNAGEVLAIVE
jgi:acetyl/propionyl-CoA carboxylase alpha subunit